MPNTFLARVVKGLPNPNYGRFGTYGGGDYARFGAKGFGTSERAFLAETADRPLDFSFQTPEYLAAQERLTLRPIRSTFSSARIRGLSASLRTGGPVGALYNRLAGQEAGELGVAGARNLLTNTRLAQHIAQQRFQNFFNIAQAAESRYQGGKKRKAGFLSSLGKLAGLGLSIAFPPAAPAIAGASAISPMGDYPSSGGTYG